LSEKAHLSATDKGKRPDPNKTADTILAHVNDKRKKLGLVV
jgi:hypothetical protein